LVNEATVPIHPLVTNLYTLLAQIPSDRSWLSVLDLKDAFFFIPLHPDSHFPFAFEWEDPKKGKRQQYTWIVLLQLRNSHLFFAQAFKRDLKDLQLKISGILQYVDDFLICSPTWEASNSNTIQVLKFLAKRG
jgi:hypothetical protein